MKPLVLWCHHDIDQPAVDNLRREDERAVWNAFAMLMAVRVTDLTKNVTLNDYRRGTLHWSDESCPARELREGE